MWNVNWRSMVIKGRRGTRKTTQCQANTWKCQAWEHWRVGSGTYCTRWEFSPRRLLSFGANENCGDATWSHDFEDLFPLETHKFRLRQVETVVWYIVDQDEVSAKPATLERKDIQSTKPVFIWQLPNAFDHMSGQALIAFRLVEVTP